MAATKENIGNWFDSGRKQNKDFMIIVCDTYDWNDYPVYVSLEGFQEKYNEMDGKNMQQIMEVYNLKRDKEEQLGCYRAFFGPDKKN